MRNLLVFATAMLFALSCQRQASDQPDQLAPSKSNSQNINFYNAKERDKAPTHEKGVVHFKLRDNSKLSRVMGKGTSDRIYTKAMQRAGDNGFHKGRFQDELKALAELRKNPDVEWASLNYAEKTQTIEDPHWTNGNLWGMANIKMPEVWQSGNHGSKQVVVGVIDEGIFAHDDLCVNIWTNPHEQDNGIDDDGNGYIDDFHGWDWFNNDNQVYPGAVHGTHVAGTIGAKNNQTGVVGVAPNVTLISCKFLEEFGYDENAIKAIDYLVDLKQRHGINIKVTSNSWGGGGFHPGLLEAIQRARDADILFVAAAGNHNANNDLEPNYPSNYNVDNIIAVGASDWGNNKASFSCFGATTVDIFAPGTGIISTVPTATHTSGYNFFSGTSMATPHVSGACALYAGLHPEANYLQIKAAILNASAKVPQLKGLCLGNEIGGNFLDVSSFTGQTQENQAPFYPCPTFSPDVNPPSIPQNLVVYETGFDPRPGAFYGGYFGVRWDRSTDPEGGAVAYIVYFNDVPTWYVGGNNYVFAGFLDTTQNIIVKVYAQDSWGNVSSFSNEDTAIWNQTQLPPDTQAPSNPSLSSTGTTQTSVSLVWTASVDNIAVVAYDIYRNGSKVSTTQSLSYTDQPLNSGTTYSYFVRARDGAGNVGTSNSISATTLPVTPPPSSCNITSNLNAAASGLTVTLNWSASITGECTIASSRLERKSKVKGVVSDWAVVPNGFNPTSPHQDVVPDAGQYIYRMQFQSSTGQTFYSNEKPIQVKRK